MLLISGSLKPSLRFMMTWWKFHFWIVVESHRKCTHTHTAHVHIEPPYTIFSVVLWSFTEHWRLLILHRCCTLFATVHNYRLGLRGLTFTHYLSLFPPIQLRATKVICHKVMFHWCTYLRIMGKKIWNIAKRSNYWHTKLLSRPCISTEQKSFPSIW